MTCKRHSIPLLGLTFFIFFYGCNAIDSNARQVLGNITLPKEFSVEFYASDVPDFEEQGKKKERIFQSSAQELDPHVAPLSMIFDAGDLFSGENKNEIFNAKHRSWNRSDKIGYCITRLSLRNGEPVSYESLADGWLQDNNAVWDDQWICYSCQIVHF